MKQSTFSETQILKILKKYESGRNLYEFLYIDTPFHKWMPRMFEYGFNEDKDFTPILAKVQEAEHQYFMP